MYQNGLKEECIQKGWEPLFYGIKFKIIKTISLGYEDFE